MTKEELELENLRLREALHYSLGAWHYDGVSDEHGSIFKEANDRCDATPPSTSALAALVEKVERRTIERCALHCAIAEVPIDIDVWMGTKKALTAATAIGLATAIRALPTGQLKLEELL